MRQVPRQVEQSLRIPEVRRGDAPNRRDAFGRIALEQGSGRDDEITKSGWNLVFQLAKNRQHSSPRPSSAIEIATTYGYSAILTVATRA